MAIEELLQQACEKAGLPNTAIKQLPRSLSDETKRKLGLMPVDTVARILKEAVNEIDHGSVARVDEIVKKALE